MPLRIARLSWLHALAFLAATLLAAACGGGSGDAPPVVPPPSAAGPVITRQPASVEVAAGEPATFTVGVREPQDTTYQWMRNGEPVAGAVGPSYTLASAQLADSGAQWSVHLRSQGEDRYSEPANLHVRPPAVTGLLEVGVFLPPPYLTPLAIDSAGNVFVRSDTPTRGLGGPRPSSVTIRKFSPDGQPLPFGEGGTAGLTLPGDPTAAAMDPAGNLYLVFTRLRFGSAPAAADGPKLSPGPVPAVAEATEIHRISPSGQATLVLQLKAGEPGFIAPVTVASNATHTLVLGDMAGNRVLQRAPNGSLTVLGTANFSLSWPDNLETPQDIAVDAAGTVYLAARFERVVKRLSADGTLTVLAGATTGPLASVDGSGGSAAFRWPQGVVADAAGHLYVLDLGGIRKVTPAGVVTTVGVLPPGGGQQPVPPRALRIGPDGTLVLGWGDSVLRARPR